MGRGSGGVMNSRAGTKSGTVKKATREEIENVRQQIIAMNKQFVSAQAQVTRAQNKRKAAMGAVYVAQNAQAKAAAEAKYKKATEAFTAAMEKRDKIDDDRHILVQKYAKMTGQGNSTYPEKKKISKQLGIK